MARVQRVIFPGEPVTYTIVGADHLPVPPAAEYLSFLCEGGASPHTVRGYAAGLARWFTMLEHTGHRWDDFPTTLFGQYLQYLRTGDLPGTPRIGAAETKMVPSSLQPRAAAVLSMYRYHADAGTTEVPYRRLFTQRGSWRRQNRYVGFLDGVGPHRDSDHPIYPVRNPRRSNTPVLSPDQVSTILDGCAVQRDGDWTGGPAAVRNRLFFAVLAETGMRLGEALSLRHNDFHIGAGGTPWIDIVERQDHPHGARVKTGPRRILDRDDRPLGGQGFRQVVQGGGAAFGDFVVAAADAGGSASAPLGPFLRTGQCPLRFRQPCAGGGEVTRVVDEFTGGQCGQVVHADVDADGACGSLPAAGCGGGLAGVLGEDAGVPAVSAAADRDGLDDGSGGDCSPQPFRRVVDAQGTEAGHDDSAVSGVEPDRGVGDVVVDAEGVAGAMLCLVARPLDGSAAAAAGD